ncbi:hypothetical protein LUQ84_3545 [Hamiltosporidium tvaerminnensis]|nr:hypothetical protein LUQ84_3545 [Hamiltosporidium tvaerminnensis]
MKIIRGFDNVPSALVKKEKEVKEEGSDVRREKIQKVSGDRKVYRSSNLGRGKK